MKNLCLSVLFVLSFNCYSQLDKTYNETLEHIKINVDYKDLLYTKDADCYMITVIYNKDNKTKHVKDTYCFSYTRNTCYLIGMYYDSDNNVNWIIESNNDNFVKLENLKWKDFKTNTIFEIVISKEFWFQMIYRDK